MEINPIRSDEDHAAAPREIERLWGAAPDTEDSDKLDILVTLVERYEDRRWPHYCNGRKRASMQTRTSIPAA